MTLQSSMGLGKLGCDVPSNTTQGCFHLLDFAIPLSLTPQHD
jgi:hypothetical protein